MKQDPQYPFLVGPVLKSLEMSALPAATFDLVTLVDAVAYFVSQKAALDPDKEQAAIGEYAASKIRQACWALRGPDAVIANDNFKKD